MEPVVQSRPMTMLFEQASQGQWNASLFSTWLRQANLTAWGSLEAAWQGARCPDVFSWPLLKQGLVDWSKPFGASPLEALSSFLYPGSSPLGYEGYWLNWQTDETKTEIYRTAQTWMESSTFGFDVQAEALLKLALNTGNMRAWREAPGMCVEHLDWCKGMMALNAAPMNTLVLDDVLRIPWNGVPESIRPHDSVGLMLKCYQGPWRAVGRYVENKAGPGLWVQFVYDNLDIAGVERRRQFAWSTMQPDGLDAWALIQSVQPAPSFEQSLHGIVAFGDAVAKYEHWARCWWVQCTLGMSPENGVLLARAIREPEFPSTLAGVDSSIFANVDG